MTYDGHLAVRRVVPARGHGGIGRGSRASRVLGRSTVVSLVDLATVSVEREEMVSVCGAGEARRLAGREAGESRERLGAVGHPLAPAVADVRAIGHVDAGEQIIVGASNSPPCKLSTTVSHVLRDDQTADKMSRLTGRLCSGDIESEWHGLG